MPAAIKVMLCPLNFSGHSEHVSHTGLGVSALNTAKTLRANGVNAIVRPVTNLSDLKAKIAAENPSHCVINALWLPQNDLAGLVLARPDIAFAVLIHSNLAFLQVESKGIMLLRQAIDLEMGSVGNFAVAANSRNAVRGLQDAYECPATYLPNLYYLDDTVRTQRPKWQGGTLRIGAFGALRPLKNPTGSAFASLAIAANLGADLEFHINTGRNDGGWADRLVASVDAIFVGLPNAKVVKNPWSPWADFRKLVRHMHLLLQPSFTESFNVVTADGVAEGVPSVVSDVIEWAPRHWQCPPDNAEEIARVGRGLLSDSHTGADGVAALAQHDREGVVAWQNWLDRKTI
jgi:hypothetical protein